MSTFRRTEKDQNMSEQQHPLVEHESTLEDTAKLPIIKPPNNRPNSRSRTSTLQPASDQPAIINGIHDPEIDESFAPTPKNGRSPLSERQTPLVLSLLEQERPITASTYFYASSAQQLDRDVIITDDYDFSEVDVDLVDMISYGLSQP